MPREWPMLADVGNNSHSRFLAIVSAIGIMPEIAAIQPFPIFAPLHRECDRVTPRHTFYRSRKTNGNVVEGFPEAPLLPPFQNRNHHPPPRLPPETIRAPARSRVNGDERSTPSQWKRACCALAFEGEYTRAAPSRCYRYRAPGCRAPFVHTHTDARARGPSLPCPPCRARILPRPAQILLRAGINLLPTFRSPLANAPRLRRKTGAPARARRRRGADGRWGGRGTRGREYRSERVDPAGARVRGIYPAVGITRYTRCPGDDFRARVSPPPSFPSPTRRRMSRARARSDRNRPRREIVSRERRRGNARRMRPRSPEEKESESVIERERERERGRDGRIISSTVIPCPFAPRRPLSVSRGLLVQGDKLRGGDGGRKFPSAGETRALLSLSLSLSLSLALLLSIISIEIRRSFRSTSRVRNTATR